MARKRTDTIATKDKDRKYHTKYLGEEPEWDTMPDDDTRKVAVIDAFNWYAYFYPTIEDYKNNVLSLIARDEFPYAVSDDDVDGILKHLPRLPIRVGKYGRMVESGWVLSDEELNTIGTDISELIDYAREELANAPVMTPIVPRKIVSPTSKMLAELDALEDAWMDGNKMSFDFESRLGVTKETKSNLADIIGPWAKNRLIDLEDDWIADAFPFGVAERNRRIKVLRGILDGVEASLAPKVRKPRRKKVVTPEMQAKGFVCQADDPETGVKSIKPVKIIGATRAFLYNAKTRQLTELVAEDGQSFSGKGMEILNVNKSKSRTTRLRKPIDMLAVVCNNGIRKIHAEWKCLTTKDTFANPRLNRTTIVLKVL